MRKLQAISFNLTDDKEKTLYEHAMKEKYFSRYIKGLIALDMSDGAQSAIKKVVEAPYIEETPKKAVAGVSNRDDLEDVFDFF